MRADFRHYARDLALAAALLGALGLNSASHAQSLDAFANIKKSKVRRGSVVAQAVPGSVAQLKGGLE